LFAHTAPSEIYTLSLHDALPILCNRRGLYLYLEELDRHRQPDRQLALLLVDVDGFKRITDRCGHLVGDVILCAIAAAVQEAAQRSEEHTSELQSRENLVCRLLLE